MGEALVVTSGKGGAGKSTVAVNLAAALAMKGKSALLIDADTGLRSLDVLLGLENNVVYDLTDVIEGNCRLKQAIVKARCADNLFLIAAAALRDASSVKPAAMADTVRRLRAKYDYIIIDCPAGVDAGFRTAIAPAERAIVVTSEDAICVRDVERVGALLDQAGIRDRLLVVNRMRARKIKRGEPMPGQVLSERLHMALLGQLGEDRAFYDAAQAGRPLALDRGETAAAFEHMARRLMGEDVPFEMPRRPSLIRRLRG